MKNVFVNDACMSNIVFIVTTFPAFIRIDRRKYGRTELLGQIESPINPNQE